MEPTVPATPVQPTQESAQAQPFVMQTPPAPEKKGKGKKVLLWVLAVLVVAGLVAGAYLWQQKKLDDQKKSTDEQISALKAQLESKNTADSDKAAANQETVADPTANWIAYKSSDGKISLKYPKTWVTASHPELCGDGILLLGANTQSVGKCASDSGGQMGLSWTTAAITCGLSTSGYTISSQTPVTADGVIGKKTVGIVKSGLEGPGPTAGVKVTQYCFTKNGTTYNAEYVQETSYPDVLADFETLVTKTLKFN